MVCFWLFLDCQFLSLFITITRISQHATIMQHISIFGWVWIGNFITTSEKNIDQTTRIEWATMAPILPQFIEDCWTVQQWFIPELPCSEWKNFSIFQIGSIVNWVYKRSFEETKWMIELWIWYLLVRLNHCHPLVRRLFESSPVLHLQVKIMVKFSFFSFPFNFEIFHAIKTRRWNGIRWWLNVIHVSRIIAEKSTDWSFR